MYTARFSAERPAAAFVVLLDFSFLVQKNPKTIRSSHLYLESSHSYRANVNNKRTPYSSRTRRTADTISVMIPLSFTDLENWLCFKQRVESCWGHQSHTLYDYVTRRDIVKGYSSRLCLAPSSFWNEMANLDINHPEVVLLLNFEKLCGPSPYLYIPSQIFNQWGDIHEPSRATW